MFLQRYGKARTRFSLPCFVRKISGTGFQPVDVKSQAGSLYHNEEPIVIFRSMLSCAVLAASSVGALHAAEKPELTRIFPAGGQAGTVVDVEATGKFPVWPIQAWSDTDSIRWSFEEKSGKLKANIDASAKSGRHWLRLYHPNGATSVRPFLVSNAAEQIEVEPNNRIADANAIASIPFCYHGALSKRGDVDLFSTVLSAGQRLVATVDSSQLLRTPVDASLQLLDSRGFVVAENLDHFGLDPCLDFIAPRESKYFVRVFGFPTTPDSTIAFGGGADWIYRLRLQPGDEPLRDPAHSSPFPAQSNILTMEPDSAALRDDALSIELPAHVRGSISHTGQQSFLRFRAVAGQQYRVQLIARELGSELDATVAILDSQGKQLTKQDDVGNDRDPDLKWKAPTDGEYFIEVKDFHQAGGPGFGFELMVQVLVPDFQLSIPSDLVQVSIGKETEIQVKLDRESDFKGEICVSLEGIPEGVDCPVVKSIHGSDTEKKITLRVKSTVPVQGPVRISAKAAGSSEAVRLATTGDEKPIWLSSVAE